MVAGPVERENDATKEASKHQRRHRHLIFQQRQGSLASKSLPGSSTLHPVASQLARKNACSCDY